MRIYLDNIVFYLQKAGGISVYWYELQKRFMSEDNKVILIEQSSSKTNIFQKLLKISKNTQIKVQYFFSGLNRYMPVFLLNKRCVFHSSYYRIGVGRNVTNIVTVHDFTYEYFRSGLAKLVHTKQKVHALLNADGIICVSENTKKDLLAFLPEVNSKEIKVIYNGASKDFLPIDSNIKTEKVILYVGDRKSSYKNFLLAVKTVEKLLEYSLVIVGGGNLTKAESKTLDQALQNRHIHHNNISNTVLNELYNQAFCLLYPSSYEGFGIPIIEAMKAGCPVVSTNFSSIPEVAGNAALLVDKISVEEFLAQVFLLENSVFRQKIIELGYRQGQKFDWDKCFYETKSFYEEVFRKKIA